MFFLTDSNFFYIIASTKRGFVFGTFGLSWKTQGLTVLSQHDNLDFKEDEEEDEDLVFNEDFLEGITSCNKVENCVILSEFEQNLMKDTSDFSASVQQRRLRDPHTKKWFPAQQRYGKKYPEAMANRGKKWNQVLPGTVHVL